MTVLLQFRLNLDFTGLEAAITGFFIMALGFICLLSSFITAMVIRSRKKIPVFKQRSGAVISGSIVPILFGLFFLIIAANGSHDLKKMLDSVCFLFAFFVFLLTSSVIIVKLFSLQKNKAQVYK